MIQWRSKVRAVTEKNNDHHPSKRIKLSKPDFKAEDFDNEDILSGSMAAAVKDEESDNDDLPVRMTGLESALAPIATDQEAIDLYESSQAARVDAPDDAAAKDGGESLQRLQDRTWTRGKTSIYVDAFNVALETVLEEESHLFDEAEHAVFQAWKHLSYQAQYLYVRLFLRKTSAWHRVAALGYHSDVGNMEDAIAELQEDRPLPHTTNDDDDNNNNLISFEAVDGHELQETFKFAEHSELITSLDEAIKLCRLDELKAMAKEAKVQGKNKNELSKGLRRTSRQQSGLQAILRRSDTDMSNRSSVSQSENDEENIDPAAETKRPESPSISDLNQEEHMLKRVMEQVGECIRLAIAPLLLFERVHLVFYRSSEWTEKSLTTIILARIARRNFPQFIVSRSASIFSSRELLLEFEASLRMQFRVDSILEFSGIRPGEREHKIVMDIHYSVLPRWRDIVRAEHEKEGQGAYQSGEGAYLRRLSPAWVYTRIMHKASAILARHKKHKEEHDLMSELLEQRLFHHARRGAWYQRKALLEEHYMADIHSPNGTASDSERRKWKRIALRTSEEGIEDPLVHIIYHHDLQKRIRKLEKACKIPMREQHDFSHVRLAAPVEVYVEGIRVFSSENDESGGKGSRRNSNDTKPTGSKGTKTIWLDPLEGNGECSVEAMCLSHYRSLGWKGFHCEGRLVRTLFAYLFFDIMFLYVPNVFQTPFQTCPLDLHTDAFYPTRMSEINQRLVEIENGKASKLIQRVWDEHSEQQTCVVGLDWAYDIDDLLDICRFFDGHVLATICKVFCQDYGSRGGGLPDLFLWHPERGEVKFSEVKSENDRLSDTQRLWIDVLTGAGVKVELCHAVARKT